MSDELSEDIPLTGNAPVQPEKKVEKSAPQIKASAPQTSDLQYAAEASDLDRLNMTPMERLIPWEECHLPSGGLWYGWGNGIVKVRAMGLNAEKILATQRLGQSGQSMDMLYKECCKFPEGFDPDHLLVGDRTFLLYYIRGITYGNMYEFSVKCPSCEATGLHKYDLNQLVSTIKGGNPTLGNEPFPVRLPYASEVLGTDVIANIRFLRGMDAVHIYNRRKIQNKATGRHGQVRPGSVAGQRADRDTREEIDQALSDNLETLIVNINGDDSRHKIRAFVSRMHSRDTTAIRDWLRVNTPSIDNTVTVTCGECEVDFTVELPITEGFFRQAKP
jgi:hypothetical protein